LKILFSKYGDWDFCWYQKSDHPENVMIRNIISKNRRHSFLLLADGKSLEHFFADGIYFYNTRIDTIAHSLFSFFLKFALTSLSRPSVIVGIGGTNSIPLGLSSILTGSRFIPVIAGEISYSVESLPKYLGKVVAFLMKVIFYKSYKILVLGKNIKKDLIDNYGVPPEKIFIYKYKISEIFKRKDASDLKILLNPNGPIVLTICRISPEKGLNYLIEASRTIIKKSPTAKIIILGSFGAYASSREKKYLEELTGLISKYNLQQHISILETSPHSEIPKYLSAADVFVLPSLSEGFPLVLLEALSVGVPVVATSVGGIPDVLIDGINSLLVKPMNVEDLADSVTKALTEVKLRKKIIENGSKFIEENKENEIETLLRNFIFEG
jgi:glycosyltransferase involved in cell wall biosynthesis